MSPSLDRPRTGKSISVAFALRACVRAKLRERDDSSVARADPMRFPGGPASCPSVRPSGCPAGPRSSCPVWPSGLAGWPGWPGLAGLRDALASRSFPLLPVRVSAANLC